MTAGLAMVAATVVSFRSLPLSEAVAASLFAGLAAIAAAHDVLTYRLPDVLTAAIFLLGLGCAAWLGPPDLAMTSIAEALGRSVMVVTVLVALRTLYRRLRGRTGLGLGDVKLAAAGAAWLALDRLAWAILIASLAALAVIVYRRLWAGPRPRLADLIIPYGAFLGPSVWLVWYLTRLGLFP